MDCTTQRIITIISYDGVCVSVRTRVSSSRWRLDVVCWQKAGRSVVLHDVVVCYRGSRQLNNSNAQLQHNYHTTSTAAAAAAGLGWASRKVGAPEHWKHGIRKLWSCGGIALSTDDKCWWILHFIWFPGKNYGGQGKGIKIGSTCQSGMGSNLTASDMIRTKALLVRSVSEKHTSPGHASVSCDVQLSTWRRCALVSTCKPGKPTHSTNLCK